MDAEMTRDKVWCEAFSSDFSVRGALRVVLDRGVKFEISDIQVRNLKTLHIEIDVGKYTLYFEDQALILETMGSNHFQNAWN